MGKEQSPLLILITVLLAAGLLVTGAWLSRITGISKANVLGLKNTPEGFIEWAVNGGAVRIADSEEWERVRQEALREIRDALDEFHEMIKGLEPLDWEK